MGGVISDQTATDFGARFVADEDAIAARKGALDALDPCRQQALAARQSLRGAGVNMQRAFDLERAADPYFSRRAWR